MSHDVQLYFSCIKEYLYLYRNVYSYLLCTIYCVSIVCCVCNYVNLFLSLRPTVYFSCIFQFAAILSALCVCSLLSVYLLLLQASHWRHVVCLEVVNDWLQAVHPFLWASKQTKAGITQDGGYEWCKRCLVAADIKANTTEELFC